MQLVRQTLALRRDDCIPAPRHIAECFADVLLVHATLVGDCVIKEVAAVVVRRTAHVK